MPSRKASDATQLAVPGWSSGEFPCPGELGSLVGRVEKLIVEELVQVISALLGARPGQKCSLMTKYSQLIQIARQFEERLPLSAESSPEECIPLSAESTRRFRATFEAQEQVLVSVDVDLLGLGTFMRKCAASEGAVEKHVLRRARMSAEQKVIDTLQLAYHSPQKLLQVRRAEREREVRRQHSQRFRGSQQKAPSQSAESCLAVKKRRRSNVDARKQVSVSVDVGLLGSGRPLRLKVETDDAVLKQVRRRARMSAGKKVIDTLKLAYESPQKLLQVRHEERQQAKRILRSVRKRRYRERDQQRCQ